MKKIKDYIFLLALAILYVLMPSRQISEEYWLKVDGTGIEQFLYRFESIRRRLVLSDSDENPDHESAEAVPNNDNSIRPMAIPIQTRIARAIAAKKRHVGYDDPVAGIAAEDFFAGMALSGLLANPNTDTNEGNHTAIAHKAYKIAKLMCDVGMNPANRRVQAPLDI
jgi:hypothetical protein